MEIVVYVTSQKALFRTSSKVKAPFPPLVALVKPIASVTAAITGRFLRLLWKRSSGEQRKKWRNRFIIGGTMLTGIVGLSYLSNVRECPYTGRKKFIVLNQEQVGVVGFVALVVTFVKTFKP